MTGGYYGSWREDLHTCAACGWQGPGEQCERGEYFRDLFEICCPKCEEKISIVPFPTIEESRANWDKLDETDKLQIELMEQHQRDIAARSLKSPEQLPELEGHDLVLTWDIEDANHGGDTLIKYGSTIVWREPVIYEGYKRFAEVAARLKERYGKRLQDLVPARRSYYFLYGDKLSAPSEVAKVRKGLSHQL